MEPTKLHGCLCDPSPPPTYWRQLFHRPGEDPFALFPPLTWADVAAQRPDPWAFAALDPGWVHPRDRRSPDEAEWVRRQLLYYASGPGPARPGLPWARYNLGDLERDEIPGADGHGRGEGLGSAWLRAWARDGMAPAANALSRAVVLLAAIIISIETACQSAVALVRRTRSTVQTWVVALLAWAFKAVVFAAAVRALRAWYAGNREAGVFYVLRPDHRAWSVY
jgi:hypothetical protein